MKKSILPWVVWGIASLFVLYQFLLQASTSVMIPQLMKAFCINSIQLGFLSSTFFYPYVALQIPAGLLTDRLGPRRVLVYSITIVALACALFAWAEINLTAEIARFLMGVASAPGVVCAMYLAARWFPAQYFALFAGLVEMLGMIGGAIGEPFLTHTVEAFGWRQTMWGCSALGALLALMAAFFVRNQPIGYQPFSSCQVSAPQETLMSKFLKVIKIKQVWLCCFFGGFVFCIISTFASLWAIPFLVHGYEMSSRAAALGSAMIFWGAALGTPVAGWLTDRLPCARWVMMGGSLLATVILSCLLFVPSSGLVAYIELFILGVVAGSYVVPFAVVKKNTCDEVHATAMGFTNMMCILIGAPILQPVVGGLLQWLQVKNIAACYRLTAADYRFALTPLLACLILAFILSFFVREKCADDTDR